MSARGPGLVGREVQEEMAALIPQSRLVLYPGYGHGTFEEQPDYECQVKAFAERVWFDGRHGG